MWKLLHGKHWKATIELGTVLLGTWEKGATTSITVGYPPFFTYRGSRRRVVIGRERRA